MEDSVDQATSLRQERLRALRAAKEYASMPDIDGDANQTYSLKPESQFDNSETKADTPGEELAEQAAASQRERLIALRTKKELLSTHEIGSKNSNGLVKDVEEVEENKAPNMKFRNYLPHDKHLQEGKLNPIDLPKFEDPVALVQRPLEKLEDPFVNIAPKKPDWDLRRDVQKKLGKVERRTQKALYEIMLEQEREKAAMEVGNAGNND